MIMHEEEQQGNWWDGAPWWVQYAKEGGAHKCICPVCDREHEPSYGGMYASLTEPCDDEDDDDCEDDFETEGPVGHA